MSNNQIPREQWAARTVQGIFQVGDLPAAAKANLPHDQFEAMIAIDLPFKPNTAQRLMKVARDKRLRNPAQVQLLPPSWGTLYELGFQHKTVLTWVKPRWGLGSYFRNASEHVLFGVRGELRTRSDSIGTIFEAAVGKHSEKPARRSEIVRAASYPPFGEIFQREARVDFTNVFHAREEPA